MKWSPQWAQRSLVMDVLHSIEWTGEYRAEGGERELRSRELLSMVVQIRFLNAGGRDQRAGEGSRISAHSPSSATKHD